MCQPKANQIQLLTLKGMPIHSHILDIKLFKTKNASTHEPFINSIHYILKNSEPKTK